VPSVNRGRSVRLIPDRLKVPFVYQITLEGARDFVEDGIRCLPAADFLATLV
jgi:hypothetical protein